MYGTVARVQVRPGMESQLVEQFRAFEAARVPGFIVEYLYRMDSESNIYYIAAVFESKAAYFANANDPAQDARYQRVRALLEADPQWHDGEIVFPSNPVI